MIVRIWAVVDGEEAKPVGHYGSHLFARLPVPGEDLDLPEGRFYVVGVRHVLEGKPEKISVESSVRLLVREKSPETPKETADQ